MTGREFGDRGPGGLGLPDRDVDLLADYLAGALEGTAAEAEVAELIRRDPVWAGAAAGLGRASSAVAADLSGWGSTPEPMPADVTDRLFAALAQATAENPGSAAAGTATTAAAAGTATTAAPEPSSAGSGTATAAPDGSAGRGRLSVVPGEGGRDRPRRRRWQARWSGPLSAAAAVLAFVGLGVWAVPRMGGDATDSGGAASAPEMRDDGTNGQSDSTQTARDGLRSGLAALPVRRFAATGVNYREDTLDRAGSATPRATEKATAPAQVLGFGRDVPPVAVDSVPEELRRLTSVPALIACLTAIGDAHPDPAVSVELVDYASFDGSPALVVVFADDTGARWVWVAGPGCGLPGVGADTRFRAKVG